MIKEIQNLLKEHNLDLDQATENSTAWPDTTLKRAEPFLRTLGNN